MIQALFENVTGAASELNNAIGYLTVAALVVPEKEAVAAMLKGTADSCCRYSFIIAIS